MGFLDVIANPIGSVINAIASNHQQNKAMKYQTQSMREQMAWQEKMNLQQQEWQENMWNMNNEYNTASAQMQRMKDAGINPNAAANAIAGVNSASQLAAQPNTPSAPGGLSAPQFPNVFGDLGGALQDGLLLNSQIRLMNAQAKQAETQGDLNSANTVQVTNENSVFLDRWALEQRERGLKIDLDKQTKDKIQFELDVLLPQQQEVNEETINNLRGAGQELQRQIKLLDKQYDIAVQTEKLEKEKINTEKAEQGLIGAQANAANASAADSLSHVGVNNATVEKINEDTKSVEYQNELQAIKVRVANMYGVDISQMDSYYSINLQLRAAGYTDKSINLFWDQYYGSLMQNLKNGAKEGAHSLGNSVSNGVGTVIGVKGLKSTVNPGSGPYKLQPQPMRRGRYGSWNQGR